MPTTAYWADWCDTTGTSTDTATWTTWTASSTSATTAPWVVWATSSTATTSDVTWTGWVTTGNSVVYRVTPEQSDAERQRIRERAAAAEAERKAARDRARQLLLSMLDVRQREQLEREQFFEVITNHSRRRYRIRQGTHGNVRLVDETGREVTSYCAQPLGVPDEDAMLAQKLMLETDEEAFLKVANARRLAA